MPSPSAKMVRAAESELKRSVSGNAVEGRILESQGRCKPMRENREYSEEIAELDFHNVQSTDDGDDEDEEEEEEQHKNDQEEDEKGEPIATATVL